MVYATAGAARASVGVITSATQIPVVRFGHLASEKVAESGVSDFLGRFIYEATFYPKHLVAVDHILGHQAGIEILIQRESSAQARGREKNLCPVVGFRARHWATKPSISALNQRSEASLTPPTSGLRI